MQANLVAKTSEQKITFSRLAFDRRPYRAGDAWGEIRAFGREAITIIGDVPHQTGVLSVRGVFVSPDTLRVSEVHVHQGRWRDYATYAGLAAVLLIWLVRPREPWRRFNGPTGPG